MCYKKHLHDLHHDICDFDIILPHKFNIYDSHCESQCEGKKQMNTLLEATANSKGVFWNEFTNNIESSKDVGNYHSTGSGSPFQV